VILEARSRQLIKSFKLSRGVGLLEFETSLRMVASVGVRSRALGIAFCNGAGATSVSLCEYISDAFISLLVIMMFTGFSQFFRASKCVFLTM
jgi:hypothetical protein